MLTGKLGFEVTFEKTGISNMMYVICETVPSSRTLCYKAETAFSELCSCIWLSESSCISRSQSRSTATLHDCL